MLWFNYYILFDEFAIPYSPCYVILCTGYLAVVSPSESAVESGGGVFGWLYRYLVAQTHSSLTAVGLVWWISSMFSTAILRMVGSAHIAYSYPRRTLLLTCCHLCDNVLPRTFIPPHYRYLHKSENKALCITCIHYYALMDSSPRLLSSYPSCPV